MTQNEKYILRFWTIFFHNFFAKICRTKIIVKCLPAAPPMALPRVEFMISTSNPKCSSVPLKIIFFLIIIKLNQMDIQWEMQRIHRKDSKKIIGKLPYIKPWPSQFLYTFKLIKKCNQDLQVTIHQSFLKAKMCIMRCWMSL